MTPNASAAAFEFDRFQRHRLLDWFDQDEISTRRALVVGAGAIGNEVLKNLALLGVGNITIIDFDIIEVHNLTRSILFRDEDVGESKATIAAHRVQELLPSANVTAIVQPLQEALRPSSMHAYDAVFSCLDSFEARLALDEMCLLGGVNQVSGAIDARYASVEFYPYSSGRKCGCYACNLPHSAYERIAQRYSCGWLRRIGLIERKIPTTVLTSSIAGSMMVSWGLRLGIGNDHSREVAQRVLADTFSGRSSTNELGQNETCHVCSDLRAQIAYVSWSTDTTLRSSTVASALKARAPSEVVFEAKCSACGHDASKHVRIGARVRDYSTEVRTCVQCGAEAVEIDARDVATLKDFADLRDGLPPDVPYLLASVGDLTLCMETIYG